jgi:hypothetical protein
MPIGYVLSCIAGAYPLTREKTARQKSLTKAAFISQHDNYSAPFTHVKKLPDHNKSSLMFTPWMDMVSTFSWFSGALIIISPPGF